VRATKLGAFHFLEKPLAPEATLLALRSALQLARARAEAQALREALGPTATLVGSSPQMAEVRALVARVAPLVAAMVAARSRVCASPYPMAGSTGPMCG